MIERCRIGRQALELPTSITLDRNRFGNCPQKMVGQYMWLVVGPKYWLRKAVGKACSYFGPASWSLCRHHTISSMASKKHSWLPISWVDRLGFVSWLASWLDGFCGISWHLEIWRLCLWWPSVYITGQVALQKLQIQFLLVIAFEISTACSPLWG